MTLEEAIEHVYETMAQDARDEGPLKAIRVPEGIALIGDSADSVFLLTVKPASFEVTAP